MGRSQWGANHLNALVRKEVAANGSPGKVGLSMEEARDRADKNSGYNHHVDGIVPVAIGKER